MKEGNLDMEKWRKVLISPMTTIQQGIEVIDATSLQIAIVVDKNDRLIGTVTDGDIRRGILKGIALHEPISRIMNTYPVVAKDTDSRETIAAIMKMKQLRQIPVVNENGSVVKLEIWTEFFSSQERDNWVILMAGGLGSRLSPLTDNCPKPLLKIGSKPILETILESFIEYGFRKYFITVNYKAEMIENYFGDGSKWGIEIQYTREDKPLGTAGALGLLPGLTNKPIIVMNGDILTKVNYVQLLDFHRQHQAQATMCVREYDLQVPYGVAKMDRHRLTRIEEKPVQRYFVNAGIYVLEPGALELIPKNNYYDMTDLFEKLIEYKCETAGFPLREYWIDVGRISDFERANGEFAQIFHMPEELPS